MLERCFKTSLTPHRLREGRVGPFLDGFAEVLFAEGYGPTTVRRLLCAADHLGRWTARRGVRIVDIDEAVIARFLRHLPACRWRVRSHTGHKGVPFRVLRFLQYLRETGVVATAAPTDALSPLATEYGAWMRAKRGLSTTTISRGVFMATALLANVNGDPMLLDATSVRGFVLDRVREHAPASAGLVTSTVRCFLRYLAVEGHCSANLCDAVPKVPTWQLAKLPRYLPDDDVERIIAACDRPNPVAMRDRAMLLLLARLGLRAGDVVGLRLRDIEWSEGRLRVIGKGRRETRLPLPQDVGDALRGYLKNGRPDAAIDHVFLTARAPIRRLSSSGLHDVLWHAIERAGIHVVSRGTHILRHSLATRLLRDGATLDMIGAVLRHRDVNTTAIYAKVDIGLLRQVAQPWPGAGVSP